MHYRIRPSKNMKSAKWKSFYSYFFNLYGNELDSAVQNHRWMVVSENRLRRIMRRLRTSERKRRAA